MAISTTEATATLLNFKAFEEETKQLLSFIDLSKINHMSGTMYYDCATDEPVLVLCYLQNLDKKLYPDESFIEIRENQILGKPGWADVSYQVLNMEILKREFSIFELKENIKHLKNFKKSSIKNVENFRDLNTLLNESIRLEAKVGLTHA